MVLKQQEHQNQLCSLALGSVPPKQGNNAGMSAPDTKTLRNKNNGTVIKSKKRSDAELLRKAHRRRQLARPRPSACSQLLAKSSLLKLLSVTSGACVCAADWGTLTGGLRENLFGSADAEEAEADRVIERHAVPLPAPIRGLAWLLSTAQKLSACTWLGADLRMQALLDGGAPKDRLPGCADTEQAEADRGIVRHAIPLAVAICGLAWLLSTAKKLSSCTWLAAALPMPALLDRGGPAPLCGLWVDFCEFWG